LELSCSPAPWQLSYDARADAGSAATHAITAPTAASPYDASCLDTNAPALTLKSASSRVTNPPGLDRIQPSDTFLAPKTSKPFAPRSVR
jgi:hypothetical protein